METFRIQGKTVAYWKKTLDEAKAKGISETEYVRSKGLMPWGIYTARKHFNGTIKEKNPKGGFVSFVPESSSMVKVTFQGATMEVMPCDLPQVLKAIKEAS